MNFSYTENPGYIDLLVGMYRGMRWYYREENWGNYTFPASFFDDFRKYYHFKLEESYPILYIAIIFTLVRYVFELGICRPIVNYLKVDDKADREKFPESCWKFVVYSFLWGYTCYLLIFDGRFNYFTDQSNIWDDWSIGMDVPFEIRLIYFIECGFYLHSIYATIFMDAWRKDFFVMLLHHVLTLTLISVSYATRYHKIGILVLFVHDITDILLEFTKCNVHLKKRNKKFYPIHETISNYGFGAFTFAWFVFRLYWFPLKILYATGVVSVHKAYQRGAGLYGFFNSLLWLLLVLDIYWFYFVLLFLYKVATGQLKEISDTRDIEEDESQKKKN
ncbi:unnamed protein product [Brachionus calyciflorus]|uniref:TLC domain-containing protein n=1 Tax=Brachionus calyciflorus TaxID=104777 RepID=A0A813VHX0_9BILA|nr:unnamed protein product [Brachionus calyciflorus]